MIHSGMTMFVLVTMLASFSLGLAQENDAMAADQVGNETMDSAATTAANASIADGEVREGQADVQGIWKLSLSGTEITLALTQSGESLFGLAKFEGDNPWNAAVVGSLSGKQVQLAMAALEEDSVASTYLGGTLEGESIKGAYVRSDSSGNAARGEFVATRISRDTSGYTPAIVDAMSETAEQEQPQTPVAPPEVPAKRSKYRDVLDLAKGIDPNIMPRMAPL